MRIEFLLGILAVLILAPEPAKSEVRITRDNGGRIGTYVDKYEALRNSGETVVVDGPCVSACTILLGKLPRDRIRVTARASFGFHAAWDFGANGRAVTSPEATRMLYSMYPKSVQQWINRKGGLTSKMVYLSGQQLAGMYGVQKQPSYIGNSYAAENPPQRIHMYLGTGIGSDQAIY